MFGHRTSDFTSVLLNIYHASQIICKRSAANVLIFMGKRAMLILFCNRFVRRISVLFCTSKDATQFLHWSSNFYNARKSVFCSAKIALLWLFASWSNVFFTLELKNEAVQNRTDVLGHCSDGNTSTGVASMTFIESRSTRLPPSTLCARNKDDHCKPGMADKTI